MSSTQSNVVIVVRLCGNIHAIVRNGEAIRIRSIGTYTTKPPNQHGVLELLKAR